MFKLEPELQSVYFNDIGILNLVLGNTKEGITQIKNATRILQENYADIKERGAALRKKTCVYKWRTSEGDIYCWQQSHHPHEQLYEYIYQNLAVVYIIEGKY